MYDGERVLKICYGAFDIVKQKTGKDPLEVFQEAMKNIMPVLEVRPRRVGGATYQVPMEVRQERRLALGIRWLIDFARKRTERTMKERLAGEILDASNNLGGAGRKKKPINGLGQQSFCTLQVVSHTELEATLRAERSARRCLGKYQ